MRLHFFLLLICSITMTQANAENWPRFRGPNGSGVSISENLPSQFDSQTKMLWKVEPGKGTSSPIVFENKMYLTSFEGTDRFIRCYESASGKELWSQSVQSTRKEIATPPCGPATPTPIAIAEGVFAFFPDFGIVGFSHAGEMLWKTEIGSFHAFHGISSSLAIADGNLIVQADQLKGSFVAAYGLKDGQEVWRRKRIDGIGAGYSTPSVFRRANGENEFVVSGPLEIVGYDAKTGNRNWWIEGISNSPISLPLVVADRVIVCEPFYSSNPFTIEQFLEYDQDKDGKVSVNEFDAQPTLQRLVKIIDDTRGDGDGAVSKDEVAKAFASFTNSGGLVSFPVNTTGPISKEDVDWSYTKKVPQIASTILYRDVLYFVNDSGILVAMNPKTGDVLKRARLGKGGRKFDASPVAADGKLFFPDVDGIVNVVKADSIADIAQNEKWNVLAVNRLVDPIHASPAIADGKIYVRTTTSLFCFGH